MANFENLRKALDEHSTDTLSQMRKAISSILSAREKEKRKLDAGQVEKFRDNTYNEYMRQLLHEDWSYLFMSYETESTDYYIYLHGDPATKKRYTELGVKSFASPFYVGMGQGGRAYTFKRSPAHMAELRRMKNQGFDKEEIVFIVADGLSEREARELESKLILFYGVQSFKNKNNDQRKDAFNQKRSLLNNQYEPMPEKYHHLM